LTIDLSVLLLIVELVLLIATVSLLILARREAHGRQLLLRQITSTAKMVSRQEYFNSVHFAMQSAVISIKGSITGSSPETPEQKERIDGIIERIHRAKSRNVTIQYLLPKAQDRFAVASKYKEAGAELRFHAGLLVSDMRYLIIDGKYAVIGLPNAPGETEPTREGYLIPSEGFAQILQQNFEEKWRQAIAYDNYLNDMLLEIKGHNPIVSIQLLSSKLGVSESEIQRILTKNPHTVEKSSE
jgi:hypothetical protein